MTPSKTSFAGYEILEPGDSLSSDGYSFQFDNPQIADFLGKIGAILHRHDAHVAMANPVTGATIAVSGTGGAIPSDTSVFVAYTLTDGQGGESLPLIADAVTTDAGYSIPGAPDVAVDYSSGTLLSGEPMYAITVTDGVGGETSLGDAVTLTVDPGHAHAEATLSGLTALTNDSSGSSTTAGWRMWRSYDGGSTWNLMGIGIYSTDTFVDTGTAGDCTVFPPDDGTTVGAGLLTVTIPSTGQPSDATFFSIYADDTGQFLTPCLMVTLDVSNFDSPQVFASLDNALEGQPPAVSQCYPGASKIDPDTDLVNWFWKSPVDTAFDLPDTGNNDGDTRITLDSDQIWIWDDADAIWIAWNPGGSVLTSTQQPSSYTLVKLDSGTVVEFTSASAVNVTIPANVTIDFPVGCVIEIFQYGAGQVTVVGAGGVTLRSDGGLHKTAAQYSTISMRQRDTDEWVLSGDLA